MQHGRSNYIQKGYLKEQDFYSFNGEALFVSFQSFSIEILHLNKQKFSKMIQRTMDANIWISFKTIEMSTSTGRSNIYQKIDGFMKQL